MITLKQLKDKLHKDFGWKNLECDNKWFVDNLLKDTIQAINYTHSCKSDSELLKIPKTTKEQRVQLNEGYNKK